MRTDISYGKLDIFLGKIFNEKIERFLDNLFDYSPNAIEINAQFFKQLFRITPPFLLSLHMPIRRVFVVNTNIGLVSCKLYIDDYSSVCILFQDIEFSPLYQPIYDSPIKLLNTSPHTSPLTGRSSTLSKKYKIVGNAEYGFQIVKGKDGTFNYINNDGKTSISSSMV